MNQKQLQKFTDLPAPILITGETGTGKSFLAKKIFKSSRIHQEKFLTVHMASLKEDLLESELFGYKKGAFTGAAEGKSGYLRDVGQGTLFLDEIGELSLEAQKKLLYLLEEKKYVPVGSTLEQDFRGRILMATNKNLRDMVSRGEFREDLYYRVNVFQLELPPLRANPAVLKEHIQEMFTALKSHHEKPYSYLTEEAWEFLLSSEWKGNLRELKNSLEYALVMSEDRKVTGADFPKASSSTEQGTSEVPTKKHFLESFPCDFGESLELFEKMYLESVLGKNGGKVNETARRLGMSKTTLIQKAKKYQINTLKMRADASLVAA